MSRASHHARQRDKNAQFLLDTTATLTRLRKARDVLTQKIRAQERAQSSALDSRRAVLKQLMSEKLPDVSIRTLTQLDILVPGFVTNNRRQLAAEARTASLGFFERLCQDEELYRKEQIVAALQKLRSDLLLTVTSLNPKPDWLKGYSDASAKLASEQEQLSRLRTERANVLDQIHSLERMVEFYSHPDAPAPDPKVAGAVATAAQPKPAQDVVHERDGDFIDDVVIPTIVWNEIFAPHERVIVAHHYDGDWDGYHDGDLPSRYDPPDGNAGVNMGEAADVDDGHAGVDMAQAAPSDDGHAGVDMGEDPVIADPAERAGVDMGEPSDRDGGDDTGAGKTTST